MIGSTHLQACLFIVLAIVLIFMIIIDTNHLMTVFSIPIMVHLMTVFMLPS